MNVAEKFLTPLDLELNIENNKNEIVHIKTNNIRKYGGQKRHHAFYENKNKVAEIAESVSEFGILVPLLIRKDPDKLNDYECLSGNHRLVAATELNLDTVPCVILDIKTDWEANQIMVTANRQREELLPTERGYIFRYEYEAMKKQGQRGTGNSLENLIEKYAKGGIHISRGSIQRYVRLTYLNYDLQKMVNTKKIGFISGVNISFLREKEQKILFTLLSSKDKYKIDEIVSLALKDYSKQKELTIEDIKSCIDSNSNNENEIEKEKKEKYTFPAEIKTFFPKCANTKEKRETIILNLVEKYSDELENFL